MTIRAAGSWLAELAKRDRISTPGSLGSWAATYSLATRFMPSRRGVTSPTLAMTGERGPEAVIPLGRRGAGITVNILGPTYGFDDFEARVSEAIREGVRRGGYDGILATA